jgi:hypothetical protein
VTPFDRLSGHVLGTTLHLPVCIAGVQQITVSLGLEGSARTERGAEDDQEQAHVEQDRCPARRRRPW